MPSLTTSWLHRTGLALQRLAVKTVAESYVGPSLTTRATSFAPVDLSPATTPEARKPCGLGDAHLRFFLGRRGRRRRPRARHRRHSSAARSASPPGTRIQSVSKVESVNTLISAAASGASSSARTPVSAKSSGPCDLEGGERPLVHATSVGTLRAAQTIEVSVAVRGDGEERRGLGPRRAPRCPGRAGRRRGSRGSAEVAGSGSRRQPHGAEPGALVEAEREVHALDGGAARCPWRGCRRRPRRPAGGRASSTVDLEVHGVAAGTDLVCGHWPSGSRCTNGSSPYAFS